MHKQPRIMGVTDVAQALGVSISLVNVWRYNGTLPSLGTPSGIHVFLERDVMALAKARAKAPLAKGQAQKGTVRVRPPAKVAQGNR